MVDYVPVAALIFGGPNVYRELCILIGALIPKASEVSWQTWQHIVLIYQIAGEAFTTCSKDYWVDGKVPKCGHLIFICTISVAISSGIGT